MFLLRQQNFNIVNPPGCVWCFSFFPARETVAASRPSWTEALCRVSLSNCKKWQRRSFEKLLTQCRRKSFQSKGRRLWLVARLPRMNFHHFSTSVINLIRIEIVILVTAGLVVNEVMRRKGIRCLQGASLRSQPAPEGYCCCWRAQQTNTTRGQCVCTLSLRHTLKISSQSNNSEKFSNVTPGNFFCFPKFRF